MAQANVNGLVYDVYATRGVVVSMDGVALDLDSLPHTFGYDASNRLVTDTVGPDGNGNYYRQTLTYDGNGNIATTSGWVKQ